MNNIAALEAQLAQLQALIAKEKGKEKVIADIKAVAEKAGYTVEELFAPAPAPAVEAVKRGRKPRDPNAAPKAEKGPAVIKYRKGDNTWSGRGRRPAWFSEAEAAGESMGQYLVMGADAT